MEHFPYHGVVHLDIKPENGVLTAVGESRLAGIGLTTSFDVRILLVHGLCWMTLYIAPEVL